MDSEVRDNWWSKGCLEVASWSFASFLLPHVMHLKVFLEPQKTFFLCSHGKTVVCWSSHLCWKWGGLMASISTCSKAKQTFSLFCTSKASSSWRYKNSEWSYPAGDCFASSRGLSGIREYQGFLLSHPVFFKPHQQFLQFTVEDRHYQFVALLFGLFTAPRMFINVLDPYLGLFSTLSVPIVWGAWMTCFSRS